ncbi:hypothetical protein [Amycolatopsis mediterranei]|uniref:hypothetical protein n=1 Tax=Amycolatopsis mediterranei TaxID=33910 RepID=UPI000AD89770
MSFVHSPAPIDAALEGGLVKAPAQRDLTLPVRLTTVQLWPEWLESEPAGDGGPPCETASAVPRGNPADLGLSCREWAIRLNSGTSAARRFDFGGFLVPDSGMGGWTTG